MIVLETPRLTLRTFNASDFDDLAELYADNDVRRFIPGGPLSREQTAEELRWFLQEASQQPLMGLWAAVDRNSGHFMGRCGLIPWTIEGRSEVEVAYMFAKEYWGQGLGVEIARGLIHYGHTGLGLPRLIALIAPANLASIKTAEKSGFRYERDVVIENYPARLYSIGACPQ